MRNNLDRDIYCAHGPIVTHQVYVPTAYVGKALACMVDRGRAGGVVGLVDRKLSGYNGDQAGPRMRVPPSISPDWERVLGDIEVGISLDLGLEVPPILVKLVAHQVEQTIGKVARRHRIQKVDADNPA
jgi:hypothetical protein